jgi:DNA-binding response OmpR family regulator
MQSLAKILLIEDDTQVADYVSSGLKKQGYAVDMAHDGISGRLSAMKGRA